MKSGRVHMSFLVLLLGLTRMGEIATGEKNIPLSLSLSLYIWNFYSKNNFKILTCWLR